MKNIKYLRIGFDQHLADRDIPKFRAAIIEKTERQASLFHNHKDDTTVIYRYPLIQYKLIGNRAGMVCLQEGVEDIHHLLCHQDLRLRIGQNSKPFPIDVLDLHYHQIQINQTPEYNFRIENWLALNQQHFQRYEALKGDEIGRFELLESILIGNILSFAKGIDWYVEEEIKLRIIKIHRKELLLFKKEKMLGFHLDFTTNVNLPAFIGLGKGSSIGFGIIEKKSSSHKN